MEENSAIRKNMKNVRFRLVVAACLLALALLPSCGATGPAPEEPDNFRQNALNKDIGSVFRLYGLDENGLSYEDSEGRRAYELPGTIPLFGQEAQFKIFTKGETVVGATYLCLMDSSTAQEDSYNLFMALLEWADAELCGNVTNKYTKHREMPFAQEYPTLEDYLEAFLPQPGVNNPEYGAPIASVTECYAVDEDEVYLFWLSILTDSEQFRVEATFAPYELRTAA